MLADSVLDTMMSTSMLLILIASCQLLLSVQGLTLRLKGNNKEIVPGGGEVNINDLPVGGCRRYDTLECLSDVPYRGRVEKAYWEYTDPVTEQTYCVPSIRCRGDDCNHFLGWQSSIGIYRKGRKYCGVVRLGRTKEQPAVGTFTCYFEGDSDSPASVNLTTTTPPTPTPTTSVSLIPTPIPSPDCSVLTVPTGIDLVVTGDEDDRTFNISWVDVPCGVDNYTIHCTDQGGECRNITLSGDKTMFSIPNGLKQIQIGAIRNDMTSCSQAYRIEKDTYNLIPIPQFTNMDCACDEND